MEVGFIILIIILSIILVGIGSYIVMQKNSEDDTTVPSLHTSGVFSLIRKSPKEDLRNLKPNKSDILEYLNTSSYSDSDKTLLAEQWQNSIEHSIRTVEEGDQNGVQTYRFELSDNDLKICTFLNKDSYLTREQIFNNPELLPPYYIGCTCRIVSKEAWEDQDKSDWQPILPVEGKYKLPDWKQIA